MAGYLAYGVRDDTYKYGFDTRWIIRRKPWTYLQAKFRHDLAQGLDNINHEVQTDDFFASLLRKNGIPWKQSFADQQRVEFFRQSYSGFSYDIFLQRNQITPFSPLPSVAIFKDIRGNAVNNLTASEVGFALRYAYKYNFIEGKYGRTYIGTKYPILDLSLVQGFKNIFESAYSYTKSQLSVKQGFNIPPFGHIDYYVYVGRIFGTLPYPLLDILPGNEYRYYESNAFQMMQNFEFIADQYAGFTFEHNLGGGMFNQIPLLRRLKLRQFWTARGVIGKLDPENSTLNLNHGYPFRSLQGNPYVEVGTGIANIFKLVRFDFVWRVMPKPLPVENKDNYFGIYISLQLQF
jgi:hypothetical protein